MPAFRRNENSIEKTGGKRCRQLSAIPNIRNAEKLGKFVIRQSGRFEYDPSLEKFYDYTKYGERYAQGQSGEFNELGYIGYTGTMSLDELMIEDTEMDRQAESQGQAIGCLSL